MYFVGPWVAFSGDVDPPEDYSAFLLDEKNRHVIFLPKAYAFEMAIEEPEDDDIPFGPHHLRARLVSVPDDEEMPSAAEIERIAQHAIMYFAGWLVSQMAEDESETATVLEAGHEAEPASSDTPEPAVEPPPPPQPSEAAHKATSKQRAPRKPKSAGRPEEPVRPVSRRPSYSARPQATELSPVDLARARLERAYFVFLSCMVCATFYAAAALTLLLTGRLGLFGNWGFVVPGLLGLILVIAMYKHLQALRAKVLGLGLMLDQNINGVDGKDDFWA